MRQLEDQNMVKAARLGYPKLDSLRFAIALTALSLLSEHCSQFHLATPELAKEFFKRVQATGPSNQVVELVKCSFSTFFLKKGRQRLTGHFKAIPQRKSVWPRNSPEGSFDFPRQLIFIVPAVQVTYSHLYLRNVTSAETDELFCNTSPIAICRIKPPGKLCAH
jgi:hypothetical protein